jgi:AcrR family transcriptional regulator
MRVPRAGLTGEDVVASAAGLADEMGYASVTMGVLADRLGVRPPSLYKHVGGLADVQHRIATLAMTELGEVIRDAVQGQAGLDALTALLRAVRSYVTAHAGRYLATIGAEVHGPDDPLVMAGTRLLNSIAAVLRGYGIGDDEMAHAIRAIRAIMHGFATLEASGGFQWDADPDQSFEWLIRFVDRGLRGQELTRGNDCAGGPTDVRVNRAKRVLRRHRQIIGRSTWSHCWRSRKALTRREKLARWPGSSVITPL